MLENTGVSPHHRLCRCASGVFFKELFSKISVEKDAKLTKDDFIYHAARYRWLNMCCFWLHRYKKWWVNTRSPKWNHYLFHITILPYYHSDNHYYYHMITMINHDYYYLVAGLEHGFYFPSGWDNDPI